MTPLAQAFSIESKKTYPLIWTNTHGKARVFVTSLGHNTAIIADPDLSRIVDAGGLCGRSASCRTTARQYAAR